jgi:tRNA threonylcarbamoyl adenosine modification protein YeaZ
MIDLLPVLVLAIEAAISGGSLCLIKGERTIAARTGSPNVSKAEDLLAEVDSMLLENELSIADLAMVAVSSGPGSFTGIRIGYATALGIKSGLGIKMASESALRAMAHAHRGHSDLLVAVPAGRNTVCYQIFETVVGIEEKIPPRPQNEETFLSSISSETGHTFLLHQDLFEKCVPNQNVINFGRNVAFEIGIVCQTAPHPQTPPLFISKDSKR